MDIQQFEGRKRGHIRHALDPRNQATGLSGLDQIRLIHEALPDLDFAEVSLESQRLGGRSPTPFFIAGMTAGHPDAPQLNQTLALACQDRGWAMGVGSQRRELESAGLDVDPWLKLRDRAPELCLYANIGISQLIGAKLSDLRRLTNSLNAQALVVHLNPLQEALQPEGTPQFRGAFEALSEVVSGLGLPVVVKETGCGFSRGTLGRLAKLSHLKAVDVSGLGGTHWGRIEGARSESGSVHERAAQTFSNWGISTVESVRLAAEVGVREIWASGGVRSGLDAAKLIALGAHDVGYAQPALEAALQGPDALESWMELQEFELRVALFCTGCKTLDSLRRKEWVWKRNDD